MKTVVIDPGHSGPAEPGAVADGVTEAEVNLVLAHLVAAGVEAACGGVKAVLTRTGDIDTDDIAFRAAMASDCGAAAFLSIHCNAHTSPEAMGVETWHFPGSPAGAVLALAVHRRLVELRYTKDRGIKQSAALYVLRATACPAALVECGFLTSPADLAVLRRPAWQAKIAAAITAGILDYLQGTVVRI